MRDQSLVELQTAQSEIERLRSELSASESRLAEAEEIISAIRSGEVDAVVVSGPDGDQIFTLQGAEYAYRALVEEMSEGAATLGSDGTVLYCNQRLANLTQRPMEQIIGGEVLNLFSGEHRQIFNALFAEASESKAGSTELELWIDEATSAPVHVSLRAMTSLEPITVCMVVTDIKHRKKNEELLAAGRLAASILDSAAEAIAVCNQDGTIIQANGAFLRLCDHNPVFRHFEKAIPLEESDAQAQRFSFDKALKGDVIRGLEMKLLKAASQPIYLLLSASPIRNDVTVIGCVLTMTDVTESKRAQAAILQSEKLASVGRMASTIAHEINNPLETIGQSLYLALTDPIISEEAKSYLNLAVVELERVALITKQTLGFHKDNSTAKKTDICELTDSVLKFFIPRLLARDIALEKRYAEVDCIEAFGGEIRQVLSNLLSNSLDALPNHGRLLIRISRAKDKEGMNVVRFLIGDSGSGIRAASLKTIFDPFFTTKEVVGTGLGLWVTRQIVEKHGAQIRVRSKPEVGTVFIIDFPAAGKSCTNQTDLEGQPL